MAIINSLNVHVFKLIGAVKPDPSLCRCLARLIKENIPETFDLQEDLDERISDSFTDIYLEGDAENHIKDIIEPVATSTFWLKHFKKNFRRDIIERSSYDVKEAVKRNSRIENLKEKKCIRNMIINATVNRLNEVHTWSTRPKVSEVREIVAEMQFIYPAMFRDDNGSGYGLGGTKGVEGLANNMLDRLRD